MNQNEFDDFFFDLKDLGCEILFNHKGMYYIHREGLGEAGWYKSLSDAIKSGHYSGNNEKYSPINSKKSDSFNNDQYFI